MFERAITVTMADEAIGGALWLPERVEPAPLILAGHGFTRHKRGLLPPSLVEELTSRGFVVAAIDAPAHGERAANPDDAAAVDIGWRAHWLAFGAARIAAEYRALIDLLGTMPEIDASRIGYFGLSLGTQYGVGVLAAEPRFHCAVLGLSALPDPGPRISAYAAGVTCPVLFIQQLDDEIAVPDRAAALFERIGSRDKTLRASPGGHTAVPHAVLEEAYDFLERHLRPAG